MLSFLSSVTNKYDILVNFSVRESLLEHAHLLQGSRPGTITLLLQTNVLENSVGGTLVSFPLERFCEVDRNHLARISDRSIALQTKQIAHVVVHRSLKSVSSHASIPRSAHLLETCASLRCSSLNVDEERIARLGHLEGCRKLLFLRLGRLSGNSIRGL